MRLRLVDSKCPTRYELDEASLAALPFSLFFGCARVNLEEDVIEELIDMKDSLLAVKC